MSNNATPLKGQRHAASHGAFTLVELLVVLAILAILMSLVFGAATGALTAAKKVQAKNDVCMIATAITAFQAEYGRLPTNTADVGDVKGALLESLMGITNSANNDNPRQIPFLEVRAATRGKGGTNGNGYVDPWNTNQAYRVSMDTNYDNTIGVSTSGGLTTNASIRKSVGVWNVTNTASARCQVRSWD